MCPPIKHTTSYLSLAGVNTRKSASFIAGSKVKKVVDFWPASLLLIWY